MTTLVFFLKNMDLKCLRDKLLIDNDMIIHNNKPTFFRPGYKSCIDHIISNCPGKISNITTHFDNTNSYSYTNNNISDHAILTCTYNNKLIKVPQLFKIIRNDRLLLFNEYS